MILNVLCKQVSLDIQDLIFQNRSEVIIYYNVKVCLGMYNFCSPINSCHSIIFFIFLNSADCIMTRQTISFEHNRISMVSIWFMIIKVKYLHLITWYYLNTKGSTNCIEWLSIFACINSLLRVISLLKLSTNKICCLVPVCI